MSYMHVYIIFVIENSDIMDDILIRFFFIIINTKRVNIYKIYLKQYKLKHVKKSKIHNMIANSVFL